jgi:hypothetical protein
MSKLTGSGDGIVALTEEEVFSMFWEAFSKAHPNLTNRVEDDDELMLIAYNCFINGYRVRALGVEPLNQN